MLFDLFGPIGRDPQLQAAVEAFSRGTDSGRGAVFTRIDVVTAILDLVGYREDRRLFDLRLLEPSCGAGDFLLPAVERLLDSCRRHGVPPSEWRHRLRNAVCAVELHSASLGETKSKLLRLLDARGANRKDAATLAEHWLRCDDFLLAELPESFDCIVGNPPYVRQERIPAPLLAEYRRRYATLYDRADLYVPFFERALDVLAPGGTLGYICANRWLKNKYGGPLRKKVAAGFHLRYFMDLDGIDAFHTDVIAYPAITVIERPSGPRDPDWGTIVATPKKSPAVSLDVLAARMRGCETGGHCSAIDVVALGGDSDAPWLLEDVELLHLVRGLESRLPLLEETGVKVGIGVATGCDRVFIGDYASLPVETERKLRLVMAEDLTPEGVRWSGKGVVNPFEEDGVLASLEQYPRFGDYIRTHRKAISQRHVATRNAANWYRTIDRIVPALSARPKLLIPDIKGHAVVALDRGEYYPHHNTYYATSGSWDLRALQAVLRSSIATMFVATYCTRMAGGFLRFQAQYLRRIRLPRWQDVDVGLRVALIRVAACSDLGELDEVVFRAFQLDRQQAAKVTAVARAAVVSPKHEERGDAPSIAA